MWPVFIPLLYSWWSKNRVRYPQLSVICSLLSTLYYLCVFLLLSHTVWTQISVPGFLFMLIFPSWDRNRCFPSFLAVRMQDLLGRFEEMAASQCFLVAGCGQLLCLAQAQQLPRQAQSTLATRTRFCPHAHTPTTGSRSKAARWRGCRVQSETEGNLVPSANGVHMSYSGSEGPCSQAQQITQTGLEGTWPQTHIQGHTKQHFHCHFHLTSVYIQQTLHPGTI